MDEPVHLVFSLHIDPAGRFVNQDDLGVRIEAFGERDLLLVTSAEEFEPRFKRSSLDVELADILLRFERLLLLFEKETAVPF